MSLTTYFLYLGTGRLLTWFLQANGLMQPIWALHPRLSELGECDLCAGFWIYLGLALQEPEKPFGRYPWLVEAVILAAISTFLAHIIRLGWSMKFGVTYA